MPPPPISTISLQPTPQKCTFFQSPKNIEIQKCEPPKMAWALIYVKVSMYPPPNPLGLCPLPLPFATVFVEHHALMDTVLTQLTKDKLSVTWLVKCVLWSFNERLVPCLYGTYSVCPLYTRIVWQCLLVDCSLSVTCPMNMYALLMRFMCSL